MNIEETVIRIIAQENHLEPGSVTLDSTFAELDLDSLEGVNVLFALETEMNITIPDTVARNMTSVRQVVECMTRVIEGKDISDLVAMAQQAVPAPQAAPAA
jgi:acyl carrier protein